jgi:hypothetical protein
MKTFLLGVGCQKGGTTWLHHYLHAHPACNLGFRKEYHVFDALWIRGARTEKFMAGTIKNLDKKARKDAKRAENDLPTDETSQKSVLLKASFYENPENYADYFDALYKSSDDIKLVGDITPSYNGLTGENFNTIRHMLEKRGFHVKVIFLMRDPVERVYSATRMRIRDQADKPKKAGKDPQEFFNTYYLRADVEMRTRYDLTMAALDEAFDTKDVHYGFYESLFNDESVRAITDFLGLDYLDPDFDKVVNSSPRDADLDQDSIDRARQYYDATYRACMDRFGEDKIKALWPHA